MAKRTQIEIPLGKVKLGWGGKRKGAGRPRVADKASVAHRARPFHDHNHPVHLTIRVLKGLTSLRTPRVARAIGNGIFKGKERRGFRVVQFSIQGNHLHFLVEAAGRRTLAAGAKGLAVRVARAVNRALGRKGQVIAARYHARAISTLRDTRAVLVYVLTNWKHHEHRATGLREARRGLPDEGRSPLIDPWSSGRWFHGWRHAPAPPAAPSPVAPAKTWLLTAGWHRLGPIGTNERPRT